MKLKIGIGILTVVFLIVVAGFTCSMAKGNSIDWMPIGILVAILVIVLAASQMFKSKK